jgi:ABC-type glutathione transport system ATPase component
MSARNSVVVIVTHRLGILRQLSHAALMQNGRLARFGTARDVIDAAAHPMSAGQVESDPKVTVLNGGAQRVGAI